jgi:hypothetical protein
MMIRIIYTAKLCGHPLRTQSLTLSLAHPLVIPSVGLLSRSFSNNLLLKNDNSTLALKLEPTLLKLLSQAKDSKAFYRSLAIYSEEGTSKRRHYLSSDEMTGLTSLIQKHSVDFTGDQIARIMKYLIRFNYKFNLDKGSANEKLLKELKSLFLMKGATLKGCFILLDSLCKLSFDWENDEERDTITELLERISFQPLTEKRYCDLVVAISKLYIPWNTLSIECQENILNLMKELSPTSDPIITRTVLYSLSFIDGFNRQELPKSVSSSFLKKAKACLQLKELEVDSKERGLQVKDLLFLVLSEISLFFCLGE